MKADEMETFIRNETTRLVMELLGVDMDDGGASGEEDGSLDPTEPLMEAGLDSLATTQLVRGLSDVFELEMSSTVLFDCLLYTSPSPRDGT